MYIKFLIGSIIFALVCFVCGVWRNKIMDKPWNERTSDALRTLGEAAAELARGLVDGICSAPGKLDLKWCLAVMYASRVRPDWIAIYERTKKTENPQEVPG